MFKIKHITIFLVSLTLAGALQAMSYTQEERDAYSQYMIAQKAAGQKPISMAQFIRQIQAAPIKQDVEGLKNKLAEKETQLAAQRRDFEQQIKDLQTTIKNQESEVGQLKKERDRRGTDLASAKDASAELEVKITALEKDQQNLTRQLRDKTAEVDAVKQKTKDDLTRAQQQAADRIKTERTDLQKRLDDQQKNFDKQMRDKRKQDERDKNNRQ